MRRADRNRNPDFPHVMPRWLIALLIAASVPLAQAQEATAEAAAAADAPTVNDGATASPAAATPAAVDDEPYDAEALKADMAKVAAWLTRERERNSVITDAVSAGDAAGVRRQLQGNATTEIARRTLMLDTLRRNLTVQRGALGVGIADAAVVEAEALFDPVIGMGYTHSESKEFERVETPSRFRRATRRIIDQNGNPRDAVVFEEGIIEYLGFDRPRPAFIGPFTEYASESSFPGADISDAVNLSLTQPLPWGITVGLSYNITDREAFFVNNLDSRRAGLATSGSYDRPWTVSLAGSLQLPLPYTRNFGPYATREVTIKLADIAYRRAEQSANQVINETLRTVDVAFFELVRAVLTLDITADNLAAVDKLVERTDRLFDAQVITGHSKSQVDAERARVTAQLEAAWAAYLQASNAINQLTDQDAGQLNLPLGYSEALTEVADFQVEGESLADASANPAYQARREDIASAELRARRAAVDARWDISVDATGTYSQNASPFGYGGFEEAMANTFDPDTKSLSAGVTLVRPWGNRGPRAARDAAALEVSVQNALVQQELNGLNRELDDALVDHASARARVDIAQRNLALKQIAYDKAVKAQASRNVTEFEIVTQNRELLDANLRWVEAIVAAKQAESRVLAAAGLLPERYGDETALSELDRLRLLAIAKRHRLRFFVGEAP